MDHFFAPFVIFQLLPIAALIPAAAILFVVLRLRNNQVHNKPHGLIILGVVIGLLWSAYGIWEHTVKLWAENESAPIRVDLLLIYPLLSILSIWFAIWVCAVLEVTEKCRVGLRTYLSSSKAGR